MSKTLINKLHELRGEREKAEDVLKQVKDNINSELLPQLRNYCHVGRSVLEKSLGSELFKHAKADILGDDFIWLFTPFELKGITEDSILIDAQPPFKDPAWSRMLYKIKPETFEVSIPLSILKLSDREYADLVRIELRKLQDKRDLEIKEAEDRASTLQKELDEAVKFLKEKKNAPKNSHISRYPNSHSVVAKV